MNNSGYEVNVPEIALIAITRVALGVGIGLLAAHRLSNERRAAAGWALLTIGVVTTVPVVAEVLGVRYPRPVITAKS